MALTFSPNPGIHETCPDFSLPSVDGKFYSRQDFFKGKPVVVMFICNHCPYVQAIESRLVQLGHDLKNLGVALVGICSNDSAEYAEDSFPEMKKRSQQNKYSFAYLHDESQEVAHAFGAVCTPDFFVYGSEGQLAYRGRLDDSWKDENKVTQRELLSAVQALLSGAPVSDKQIPSMGCSIKWKE